MTEIKFQLNTRLTNDANVSVTITKLASTEEEAEEAGKQAALEVSAFMSGYGKADVTGYAP